MINIKDPSQVSTIPDPAIRSFVQKRFIDICDGLAGEPFDPDLHGYLIVVEPGDTVAALEKESRCRILYNIFDDTHFGSPNFTPACEFLDEYEFCFDMLFILSDSGYGINFFIPKQEGIDAELLAMCSMYSTPPYSATHTQP